MKSIRCRMGWHKRRIIGRHSNTYCTECERCGELKKCDVNMMLDGPDFCEPLCEHTARKTVQRIDKVLNQSFEEYNEEYIWWGETKTKAEFQRYHKGLYSIRAWFMKHVGDWRPSLDVNEEMEERGTKNGYI